MKIRELAYTCMSVKWLKKRADINNAKFECVTDPRKLMRLIDEEFDILNALVNKNVLSPGFLKYAEESLSKVLIGQRVKAP